MFNIFEWNLTRSYPYWRNGFQCVVVEINIWDFLRAKLQLVGLTHKIFKIYMIFKDPHDNIDNGSTWRGGWSLFRLLIFHSLLCFLMNFCGPPMNPKGKCPLAAAPLETYVKSWSPNKESVLRCAFARGKDLWGVGICLIHSSST